MADNLQEARALAWPPITRGKGATPSERHLARLAERSFLSLWSYPNLYWDVSKELCDLLVICGDDVLIFSDKTITWPDCDTFLAWSRWYKKAIHESARQIRGALRRIRDFPDKIFLDRLCKQPFPLALPPQDTRRVHAIIVASGAGQACSDFFGSGIGSLLVSPSVKGCSHFCGPDVLPFTVGDVNPDGPFFHVFDDVTLNIIMHELDTVTDFTSYLGKKEKIIRAGKLVAASGEESLVSYYMTHVNVNGEHDFTKPDGSTVYDNEFIVIDDGYDAMLTNSQYIAKKQADRVSYKWDSLIEAFTTNMLSGTTIIPEGQAPHVSQIEEGVRHMALVPRLGRRFLGAAIEDALLKGKSTDRFVRVMTSPPNSRTHGTGFFFMTMKSTLPVFGGDYEKYRCIRRTYLETYALEILRTNAYIERVVGISTEPMVEPEQHTSEDMVFATRPGWTPELLEELEIRKKALGMLYPNNCAEYAVGGREWPETEKH